MDIRVTVEDLAADYERQLGNAINGMTQRLVDGGDLQYAGADQVAAMQVRVRLWRNVTIALTRNEERTDGEVFTELEVLGACLDAVDEKLLEYTPRSSTSALANHLDVIEQNQRVDFRRELDRMIRRAKRN